MTSAISRLQQSAQKFKQSVTAAAHPVPKQAALSPAEQFAQQIAAALPHSAAIPTFDQSGLYDEAAADRQYEAEFAPYYQRQNAGLDAQKQFAQQALERALGSINAGADQQQQQAQADYQRSMLDQENAEGSLGQTGSGVAQRARGMIQDVLNRSRAAADQYRSYASGSYQQDYKQNYESPYSAFENNKADLRDQQTIGQQSFRSSNRNEAYQRYLQRYQNQPRY